MYLIIMIVTVMMWHACLSIYEGRTCYMAVRAASLFTYCAQKSRLNITFLGFSLHIMGLSKRRVLPKAALFNALSKQRLEFSGFRASSTYAPRTFKSVSPSGLPPFVFSYC